MSNYDLVQVGKYFGIQAKAIDEKGFAAEREFSPFNELTPNGALALRAASDWVEEMCLDGHEVSIMVFDGSIPWVKGYSEEG